MCLFGETKERLLDRESVIKVNLHYLASNFYFSSETERVSSLDCRRLCRFYFVEDVVGPVFNSINVSHKLCVSLLFLFFYPFTRVEFNFRTIHVRSFFLPLGTKRRNKFL